MTPLLAILGPTAAGKTQVAVEVARRLGAEILSVDSMQVYRGMDIGTAKPSVEERGGIVHHMVDIVDPAVEFSVAEFQRVAREVIGQADVPIIITGGSGLHFRATVDPMTFAPADPQVRAELDTEEVARLVSRLLTADPSAGAHIDLDNKRRVVRALEVLELTGATPSARASTPEAHDLKNYVAELEFTAVGIDPGPLLEGRIDQRLSAMAAAGLAAEVKRLWPTMGRTSRSAVGYREIGAHFEGRLSLDQAFAETGRATKRLARRQRTWFQRDPRIKWIPWSADADDLMASVVEALA